MKPELVSEETIQGLALDEINKLDLKDRDKTDAMWAAIHTAEAALEELGIVRVEEVGDGEYVTVLGGSGFEGAVLVRAKLGAEEGK